MKGNRNAARWFGGSIDLTVTSVASGWIIKNLTNHWKSSPGYSLLPPVLFNYSFVFGEFRPKRSGEGEGETGCTRAGHARLTRSAAPFVTIIRLRAEVLRIVVCKRNIICMGGTYRFYCLRFVTSHVPLATVLVWTTVWSRDRNFRFF